MNRYAMKLLGAAVAISLITTAATGSATELLLDKYIPNHHPLFKGMMKPFAERVAAESNEKLTIKFSGAPLAPNPRQWHAVESGISDIQFTFAGFEADRLKLILMGQLPFLAPDAASGSVALWRTHKEYFEDAKQTDFDGVKLLGAFSFSGGHITTAKPKITSIEDLKGVKIASSAGFGDRVMKALGAVSVPITGATVFDTVSKGVVDGIALPDYALSVFKLARYLKYSTEVLGGLYSFVYVAVMNENKWNSLTAEEKRALEAASFENISRDARVFDSDGVEAVKELAASGVERFSASDAMVNTMVERLKFLEDEWKKDAQGRGVDGSAALAFYRAQVKQLSGK